VSDRRPTDWTESIGLLVSIRNIVLQPLDPSSGSLGGHFISVFVLSRMRSSCCIRRIDRKVRMLHIALDWRATHSWISWIWDTRHVKLYDNCELVFCVVLVRETDAVLRRGVSRCSVTGDMLRSNSISWRRRGWDRRTVRPAQGRVFEGTTSSRAASICEWLSPSASEPVTH
jgi:hypothetical protein